MARTHGTRRAYNADCRCDACRKVLRLATARERSTAAGLDQSGRYGAASHPKTNRPSAGVSSLSQL